MRTALIVLSCVLACACGSRYSYTISGTVSGIDDGTYVYLCRADGHNTIIDSTQVMGESFGFCGTTDSLPYWALVKLKNRFIPVASLYIEPGHIIIEGESSAAEARGTFNNDVQTEYNRRIAPLFNTHYAMSMAVAMAEDDAARDSARIALDAFATRMLSEQLSFISDHSASLVSLSCASYISRTMNGKEIENVLSLLDPSVRELPEAVEMASRAEQLKKSGIGMQAPDFTLTDADGRSVALSDFRGRWVLLDFWASWCAPCRAQLPLIAGLEAEYAPKGLEVIGISLDKERDQWLRAVEEDGCRWLQLRDAEGTVAHDYAILSIPNVMLISPEGEVVARNLTKDKLEDALSRNLR